MNISELQARSDRVTIALTDMRHEARRALDKHGPEQTMDAVHKTSGERLAILMEEVGEVAKELTYDQQGIKLEQLGGNAKPVELFGWENGLSSVYYFQPVPGGGETSVYLAHLTDREVALLGWSRTTATQRLRKELVQVGAMAATWVAALDAEQ